MMRWPRLAHSHDLATGAITGDATGSAGQKLKVSDSAGDAVWFTLSTQ
jgi:hypothetical protein